MYNFLYGVGATYLVIGIWMTYQWESVSSSKILSWWYALLSMIISTLGWPFGLPILFNNFRDIPPYAAVLPKSLKKEEEEKIDDADIPAQRTVRSTGQKAT